jgi:hypothetical protein
VDEADEAQERIERRIDEGIARARAKPLEKGQPGDCDLCGEWAGRLVLGACAPCRDKWGLE